MKLSTRDATKYFQNPDPEGAGVLIYGEDAMRVALKRAEALKALLGENADAEMRLTRFSRADLSCSPGALVDTIRTVGFFPGSRVALVEDATDQVHSAIEAAAKEWKHGDAQIFVTAGQLRPASKLRKLFENQNNLRAAAIYDNPPTKDELQHAFELAGLKDIDQDCTTLLVDYSRELGPGDFQQLLKKIAIFKLGDEQPLSVEDIVVCAPESIEAALDDLLNIVAEGRPKDITLVLHRLIAQGTNPVAICIAVLRHFRTLYSIAAHPKGLSSGLSQLKPPVFGFRRDRLARQVQIWRSEMLEAALHSIIDTDLTLRSASQTAPAMALVERTLIRLAMIGQRKNS